MPRLKKLCSKNLLHTAMVLYDTRQAYPCERQHSDSIHAHESVTSDNLTTTTTQTHPSTPHYTMKVTALLLLPSTALPRSHKNNKKDQESSPLAPFLKSIGNEDCDRPACDDTKSALTAALNRVNAAKKAPSGKESGPISYRACPPTKDEIGVSTWTLLHSMVRFIPIMSMS